MLQPRARAPAEGEAIKWGHWSECSELCVKVRHRLNCDDILPQLPAAGNLTASSARPGAAAFGEPQTESRRRLSKRLLEKASQVTGFSGHDEDNKSTEEQDEESLLAKADQVDESYQDEESNQEAETDMCDFVDLSNTMEERPCTGGLCRRDLPVPSQATAITSTPSSVGQQARILSSGGNKVRARERVSKQRTVNGYREEKTARGQSFDQPDEQQELEVATRPRAGLLASSSLTRQHDNQAAKPARLQPVNLAPTNINQTLEPIWSSRGTMWFASPTAQTARIIEWTIIVGSLLFIVLLIMMILRKLLASSRLAKTHSSYQWMLAKQTQKEQSMSNTVAAFCRASSTAYPTHLVQFSRQPQASDDRSNEQPTWSASAERQLSIDATGRHLFSGTFNTDVAFHQQLVGAKNEAKGRVFAGLTETDGNSVISIYDYDTLGASRSSGSHNQELAKGAFLPTRDFVAATTATPRRSQTEWAGEKHKSPNVPAKGCWNNTAAAAESRSSSLASSGRSSATAQMLSNGASSAGSFDQHQPSQGDLLPVTATPSLDCSPASLSGARGKLIGLSLQPAHSSQPSTPLCEPTKRRPDKAEARAYKSSSQPDTRRVLRLASEFESAGSRQARGEWPRQLDEEPERHFYEEISSEEPKQPRAG